MTVYAKPIENTELGNDLNAGPDKIFRGQAFPNNTSIDSSGFRLGNVMGRNEIKAVVSTAGTLGTNVTIEVKSSADSTNGTDGTFTTVEGGSFVIQAGAIAVGDELVKYIPPRETTDCWFKVAITTTADESANGAIDSYLVYVS